MCGICGFLGKDKNCTLSTLKHMTSTLIHRGPDEEGFYFNTFSSFRLGLGMRRLSIIDLVKGKQPMFNEDRSIVVIFNGEIYNFIELKNNLIKKGHRFYTNSDTEVIPHLYEEYGENFVKHLRGMFAIALWDEKERKIVLARDRFGIKPLYYYLKDNLFIFGSEIKAITKFPTLKTTLSNEGIILYFSYKFIPEPFSIYKEIHKLPPATILILKNGKKEIKKYWDFPFEEENIKESEAIEKFSSLLQEAVEKRLISDVPLGLFLSGGIDSSTILWCMSKSVKEKIKTFTIGFKEREWDESKYAEILSRHFNTEHHSVIISPEKLSDLLPLLVYHFDEPFADASMFPTYYVSKIAKEKVKVVLAGDGGDEICMGYTMYHGLYISCILKKVFSSYTKDIVGDFLSLIEEFSKGEHRLFFNRVKRVFSDAYIPLPIFFYHKMRVFNLEDIKKLLPEVVNEDVFRIPISVIFPLFTKGINDFQKLNYSDFRFHLLNDMLVKVDRMSMANSIEVRVPFLDHKLVDFVFKLPYSLKIRWNTRKYLIKKILKGNVPQVILRKRKKGFSIPLKVWFRGSLKDAIEEIMEDYKISIINKKFVKEMIEMQKKEIKEYGEHLWTILVFYYWARENHITL